MNNLPNIFLISVDCLRADFVDFIGEKMHLTPNLNKIAKEGVLFRNAFANGPYTISSFQSILTSTYPSMFPGRRYLSEYRTTIAEVLRKHGYKTAGFNKNPYLSRISDYSRDFDYYYDILTSNKSSNTTIKKIIKKTIKAIRFRSLQILLKSIFIKYYVDVDSKELNRELIRWIKEIREKYFIWIHYMDVHMPYIPPKKFRTINNIKTINANEIVKKNPKKVTEDQLKKIISLYKSSIIHFDYQLGKLINELKKNKQYHNSLFIITADHGDEFKEHGDFSHGTKLYDELIHVPLIIKGPNIVKNKKIGNLISLIDLPTTILDYLKIKSPKNYMGLSFLNFLKDNENHDYNRKHIFSEILQYNDINLVSCRTKNWKCILSRAKNIHELYDLRNDKQETKNLYYLNREKAKRFEEKILMHLKQEEKNREEIKEKDKIKMILRKMKINK